MFMLSTRFITDDVNFDQLGEVVRQLSLLELPLPPFPYCSLWKEFITCVLHLRDESYVAQLVRNPPAMWET